MGQARGTPGCALQLRILSPNIPGSRSLPKSLSSREASSDTDAPKGDRHERDPSTSPSSATEVPVLGSTG